MAPRQNETRRLAALARSGLLTAQADETFASLIGAAADAFGMPISTLSLIGRDTQSYFAAVGLGATTTDRAVSLCSHTIATNAPFMVLDTRRDPQWRDTPLVREAPYIRFYAGVPIHIEGQPVGTFCVIDTVPHHAFGHAEQARLQRYAAIAAEMLELRSLRALRDRERTRFRLMAEASPDATVIADAEGQILYCNANAEALFGHAAGSRWDLKATDGLADDGKSTEGFAAWIDAIAAASREVEIIDRDGVARWVELSVSRWHEDGETFHGIVLRDVTARREKDRLLHSLAHRDGLTGLPNRAAMRARLEAALRDGAVAVLLVDLDGFKDVNDTVGHAAGDDVLREAAARLGAEIQAPDSVGRIGGDEFLAVLPHCGDPLKAAELAERIVGAMEEPILVGDQTVRIGASIGIALAPSQAETIDELLFCADLAVYKAKADGRHRQRLYMPSLRAVVTERQRFVHEFHRAVENAEFVLHYQPQVRLRDGAVTGAEALIRWQHPELGLLQPATFLPALLASRHAMAVNDWVLHTACAQAVLWLRLAKRDFRMGVNACAVRLRSGEIAGFVLETLAATGLPPQNLELEITETVVLADEGVGAAALSALRSKGVGVAFDDFGTGYASLSLLEDFPLTRLKIDRSFVRKMNDAPEVPVIRAILQLAKSFGLDVVAEGIETQDQLRRLRKKGCAEGQGYLFGRPVPAEQFERSFLQATPVVNRRSRRMA